uniref:Putative theta replicase n=1 Tax=Rhodococcus sp. B264-1 TaxID=233067 RepID=Q79IS6_9NOCA|nr:putative theta replicase [Rhodococcus sp. B264-1]
MTERLPRNGITVRELAERTGVSTASIIRWTSEPREAYLSRAQQRREKIRELRGTGMSMRAIANELGCSVGTVHHALAGIER